jgi:predicted AlkP superfamily pyrophosphatase or phosphodiesterase
MHRLGIRRCALLIVCEIALIISSSSMAAERERHVVLVSIDGFAAYLLDDPKAPIPTVRNLAREGSYAEGGMKVSNPSVTWPNHTSMITGVRPEKHGVLANGVVVRGPIGIPVKIDPRRDQQDLIRVPTIIDAAHAAGLRTAEINWPCTRGSKSLDDSFPDVPDAVLHMTPRLRSELIAKGLLTDETQESFRANSYASWDLIWTEAACHVIRERKPHLLLLHLLNVDLTHHTFGPQTQASYTANGYADMCLSRIIAAIEEAGIRDQTTLFVVADHGHTTTPKAVRAHVLLRQHGLLTVAANKISEARAHVFSEGGTGLVYCTSPGDVEADRELISKLFTGQEGIAQVLLPNDYLEHGMPHPREYPQAPDAILVTEDGYCISESFTGDTLITTNTEGETPLGSHGFLTSFDKMNALCVVAGNGVRSGAKLQQVENIDVAATIAKLLSLNDFATDGKVLTEALTE